MKLIILPILLMFSIPAFAFNASTQFVLRPHNIPNPAKFNKEAFKEVPTSVKHKYTDGISGSLAGAAVLDFNNDGAYEIFFGGGANQEDFLLSYKNGEFVNVISNTGLSSTETTYGSTAIDMNDDGYTDLLIAREDGAFLYLNNGNGTFQKQMLPIDFAEDETPVSISVADIDQDGDADLYVSVFVAAPYFKSLVFNDAEHAKMNYMLLNTGNLNFVDITNDAGTAGEQNTFFSTFADLNNDGYQELIVAQNTGRVEIFKNNKDATFSPIEYKSPLGFWMGIAVGDIDQDGDLDLLFSNSGNTVPSFLIRLGSDLEKGQKHNQDWLLLRNEGDFNFTNVSKKYGLKRNGFAWGTTFDDLDNDGDLDFLISRNYVKFPFLIKKLRNSNETVFTQVKTRRGKSKFKRDRRLNLNNSFYGISPVIVDFNGDGKQDVLWLNIDGPVRAFINQSNNNFMTFRFPDKVAYLGAKLELVTETGSSYTKEVIAGQGLLTDNSPEITFGLGKESNVKFLKITFPNGRVKMVSNLTMNAIHNIIMESN